MALPLQGINVSTVVVYNPPANFSFSLFTLKYKQSTKNTPFAYSFNDRHSQKLLINLSIEIQNVVGLLLSLFESCMGSVALLPEELSRSDEWGGVFELPSDNIGPLIQLQRQVSVTGDPFGVGGIHDGLTSWSNGDRLIEVSGTIFSDPCYLWSETFDMLLFCG